MRNRLFREKSLAKLSSPDALNEYVRVANPSVWIILISIIIVLGGIIIWAISGQIDLSENVTVYSDGETVTCYILESSIDNIGQHETIYIDGNAYELGDIPAIPTRLLEDSKNSYIAHVMNIPAGSWVYEIDVKGNLPEGVYTGNIVTETIKPIKYVIN